MNTFGLAGDFTAIPKLNLGGHVSYTGLDGGSLFGAGVHAGLKL